MRAAPSERQHGTHQSTCECVLSKVMCCSVLRAAEETMTGRAAGSDQTSIMLGLQEQVFSISTLVQFPPWASGGDALRCPVQCQLRRIMTCAVNPFLACSFVGPANAVVHAKVV
jgi:hypothetical protein